MYPLIERRLLFRHHEESHVSVLQAAKFRALTAIDARTLRPQGKFIGTAGDEVLFARETRHPERVNDINAFELQAHVTPDRNMDFVRRLKALGRRRTEILYAPPPLQASHLDSEIIMAADAQRTSREETGDRERADDQYGGCRGREDSHRQFALGARIEIDRPLALATSAP